MVADLKITPLSIAPEYLVRGKATLVGHGRAAGNVVTEIDVRNIPGGGLLQDGKNVPDAERAVTLRRIVEEINSRKTCGQNVDIADADQPVRQIIAPFFGWKRVMNEGIRILPGPLGGMLGPALGPGLEGMI